MKKKHLIILLVVVCVIIAGVIWFSSKKPASPDIPEEMLQETTAPVEAPSVVIESQYEKVEKSLPADMSPEEREQVLAMYDPPFQFDKDEPDPRVQARMTKMGQLAQVSMPYAEEYTERARPVVVESLKNVGVELNEQDMDIVMNMFMTESIDQSMRFLPLWELGVKNEGKARDLVRAQGELDWEFMMFCKVVTMHVPIKQFIGDQEMDQALNKLSAQSQWFLDAMRQVEELREEVEEELMQ